MGQPVIALMWGVRASSVSKDLSKEGEWYWEDYTAARLPHDIEPRDTVDADDVRPDLRALLREGVVKMKEDEVEHAWMYRLSDNWAHGVPD